MSQCLRRYLDFAVETAYLAGRTTLSHFQTGVQAEFKPDQTPVTIADRQAEELIRRRIEEEYPQHAIMGEEYGFKEADEASHRWFVDPIDGTKSFMRGVPLYAVLIGLEIEGTVQVGVAYFPALDEMLAAATGEGCWWNGRRARVSSVPTLDQAVVAFTDVAGFYRYGRSEAWERIQAAAYYRAGWGDAYGHLLVATGRVELMLLPAHPTGGRRVFWRLARKPDHPCQRGAIDDADASSGGASPHRRHVSRIAAEDPGSAWPEDRGEGHNSTRSYRPSPLRSVLGTKQVPQPL
jgi:histidinol-phosphatase